MNPCTPKKVHTLDLFEKETLEVHQLKIQQQQKLSLTTQARRTTTTYIRTLAMQLALTILLFDSDSTEVGPKEGSSLHEKEFESTSGAVRLVISVNSTL